MAKIAIIGAGGYVFPLRLVGDLLSFPALRDSTLSLMDVHLTGADRTAAAARELIAHHGFNTKVDATDDRKRKRALDGADYVIVTFQVGGVDAYYHDVHIPRKYGLDQTVGDTLGPGGVFRFLRSAPAYREIAVDMKRLCPNALLVNYANPMAMACWYLSDLGVETVGLCHSVQGTSRTRVGSKASKARRNASRFLRIVIQLKPAWKSSRHSNSSRPASFAGRTPYSWSW